MCPVELTASEGSDAELWQMQQIQDLQEEFYVVCQADADFVLAEDNGRIVLQNKTDSIFQIWELVNCEQGSAQTTNRDWDNGKPKTSQNRKKSKVIFELN